MGDILYWINCMPGIILDKLSNGGHSSSCVFSSYITLPEPKTQKNMKNMAQKNDLNCNMKESIFDFFEEIFNVWFKKKSNTRSVKTEKIHI